MWSECPACMAVPQLSLAQEIFHCLKLEQWSGPITNSNASCLKTIFIYCIPWNLRVWAQVDIYLQGKYFVRRFWELSNILEWTIQELLRASADTHMCTRVQEREANWERDCAGELCRPRERNAKITLVNWKASCAQNPWPSSPGGGWDEKHFQASSLKGQVSSSGQSWGEMAVPQLDLERQAILWKAAATWGTGHQENRSDHRKCGL